MRALILCPEKIGHGRPAGVGIRMIELARALTRAGHQVTLLSRDAGAAGPWRAGDLEPSTIRDASREADLVIVQGHVINDYLAHSEARPPLVIDAYDPYLIENLHYAADHPDAFIHDHGATVRALLEGDFFLCASEGQRLFYIGMLTALGRVNPGRFRADPSLRKLIAVVPFGVPDPRPIISNRDRRPAFLFGGIYDWYRPDIAIEAISRAREELPEITLTFVAHTNQAETPQGRWADATRETTRRGLQSNVRFAEWFAYETRTEVYDQHAGALLTFEPSIETDLSFRTRVLDYLWGGLPVITSSASETDRLIEHYEAGIVIRSNDPQEFAEAMGRLVSEPGLRERLVQGTRRFAADYQWDTVTRPLLEFSEAPRIDPTKYDCRREPTLTSPESLRSRVTRKLRKLL